MESPPPPIVPPIVVVLGEVLWDRFETGDVLGGAPLNVAWNLKGFGLDPLMVSRVGDDELGHRAIDRMKAWGMRTDGIQIDPDHDTGVVDVTLDQGEPSYDIVKNVAYDHIAPINGSARGAIDERIAAGTDHQTGPDHRQPIFFYHGSLAYRGERTAETIRGLRQELPADVFFDINVRQPHFHAGWLGVLMHDLAHVKLNADELRLVTDESAAEDPAGAAQRVFEKYQQLQSALITLGSRGAMWVPRGGQPVRVTTRSPGKMVDAVGAGDAFAAVTIAGLVGRHPIAQTLAAAAEFASRVCTLSGATTDDPEFYEIATLKLP